MREGKLNEPGFFDRFAAKGQYAATLDAVFDATCKRLGFGEPPAPRADERTGTRALLKRVSAAPPPQDAVTRGCYVLAAYGAVALGDVARSAELVLGAGGDADLSGLRLIDRAIGLELLIAASLASHDIDSAESWLSRLEPIATLRVAAPTYNRALSRVLLLKGDITGASEAAERAIAAALAEGRAIEAAEGEVVRARALIAADERGDAARGLAVAASDARSRGHLAMHRAAARELRQVGRRLPPEAASGWEGLSAREREVAVLVAEGHSNASLASELFLSAHTVRIHVSRVLQAFGVATRSGVAAALAPALQSRTGEQSPPTPLPGLTERQAQVVAMVVEGSSNKQIADALTISQATVEKHMSAIMRKWGVSSRTGVVARAGWPVEHTSG
jgi:DNA-binding NarL/FixJ family response regulator